jgi:hypothetical protein
VTENELIGSVLFVIFYSFSVFCLVCLTEGKLRWDDAFWWPILLVKVVTKSLFRVLFTGWRL